jgi:hypothetical protein
VEPGLLATPFGHWGHPGIVWQCGGGGSAVALGTAGNEPPRGQDRPRSWEGLAQGASGMARRARRDGGVTIGAGLQGATAWGDARLDPERMRRDDPVIGGEGG